MMEFARNRKRNREIGIIPLIDVAMFLLIFFMVVGTVEKFDIIPIDPPEAQSGKLIDEGHIQILLGQHNELVLNDDLITIGQLQESIHKMISLNPNKIITVKADANVPAVRMIQVMDRIKAAGGKNLSIATRSNE